MPFEKSSRKANRYFTKKVNIKHKNLLIFSEMAIIVSKKKGGGEA